LIVFLEPNTLRKIILK